MLAARGAGCAGRVKNRPSATSSVPPAATAAPTKGSFAPREPNWNLRDRGTEDTLFPRSTRDSNTCTAHEQTCHVALPDRDGSPPRAHNRSQVVVCQLVLDHVGEAGRGGGPTPPEGPPGGRAA